MQKEDKSRLLRRLLALTLLLGCLAFVGLGRTQPVAADGLCDFQYSMCQAGCQNQWPQDYACYYGCDIAYNTCVGMGN